VSVLPRVAQWKSLLNEDDDFRRWYENLARGSKNTADLNARTLFRFSKLVGFSPYEIVNKARNNRRRFEDQLFDFVTYLKNDGKAPSYIDNYLTCVKSWLRFNDILLVRKINVGNTARTPTIEDERVPTKAELKQILNLAKARGKCSISFMAFSGLRPQVLGNSAGSDGLKIRDLPELLVNNKTVEFEKIPTMMIVRSELSKAKHKYFTFLGSEGCDYLKTYLDKRLAEGEVLSPGSPVIAFKKGYGETGYRETDRTNEHITRKTLTKEIRTAMRPKYKWRPYVLRSYFDTQLLVAENNGKIAHAYRQFFMGHKGDMEARYTTHKGMLPVSVIEDMRSTYDRCLEYLETSVKNRNEDRIRDDFKKQLLLIAGYSPEEIESIDLNIDDVSFQETVRSKLLGSMVNNGNRQRVVSVEDLEDFINKGWEYVAKISEDKVIIKIA
jgi:hypothetical protein